MRNPLLQVLISGLILAGAWPSCEAQFPPVKLTQVGALEDYSFVQTHCVYQDSRGFIWIGTHHGLDRWDGNRMMSYTHNPFDTLNLFPEEVRVISEDNQNRLWLSDYSNLYRFDLETEHIETIPFPGKEPYWRISCMKSNPTGSLLLGCEEGLYEYFIERDSLRYYPLEDPDLDRKNRRVSHRVNAIAMDTTDIIWVTGNHGLLYLDRTSGVFKPQRFNNPELPDGKINCLDMCSDKEGNFWMLDEASALVKFNPVTKELSFITPREMKGPSPISKGAIHADKEGKVWYGDVYGLMQYDPCTGLSRYLESMENPSIIRDIMEDNQGNLFVATFEGVSIVDQKAREIEMYPMVSDSIIRKARWINEVVRDEQSLWLGTYNMGVIRYYPETGKAVYYGSGDQAGDLSSDYIYRILQDWEGSIWVMAGRDLHLYNPKADNFERFSFNLTHFITKDQDGFFWISGSDFLLRFDPLSHDTLSFQFRESLPFIGAQLDNIPFIRDRDGIFWMGGFAGLYRIDPFSGEWTQHVHIPGNSNSLPENDVRSLLLDRQNRLWVGTSNGLSRVVSDPGTDSISFVTDLLEKESLGNQITDMLEDASGNIWFGTSLGAYVLRSNGSFEAFTFRDGLPEIPRLIWTLNLDSEGYIYAGFRDLVRISPDFLKPNPFIPPIMLSEFRILGELILPGDKSPLEKSIISADRINLKHDQNFIRIDYAALNYTEPQRNRYRYILEGVDPDTVEAGVKHYAEYTNLAPGKYTFWVTGSNNTGTWNPEGTSVVIRVNPPWYSTLAALIAYAFFLLSVILVYLRIRTAKYRRDKMRLEKQVAERTLELRRYNEQIVEMERLKTSFFTNVSHEIRTPITLINGPLEKLIRQDHPDPKTGSWLTMIQRNSERLLQLVNQLLDITKLDSGKMKLVIQESDVMAHLRLLVNQYLSLAETKRVRYIIDIPEEKHLVWYDREKVEKICNNLISNAFKFTPEFGVITCRVKLLHGHMGSTGLNQLRIIVADTGPGIPMAEREKIFERFYQAKKEFYEDAGGTGIGLSLTRELIGMMHGEVVLKSLEGTGAVFIVTLPLGLDHLREDEYILKEMENVLPREEVVTEPKQTIPGKIEDPEKDIEVMIVEDSSDLRTFISENLSGTYKILQAEDGFRGLQMARTKIPDLIISDVMMPGMDGMELCKMLKNDERTCHIPVILLTAKSTSKDRIEGLDVGADDYIYKPFSIGELSARIRNLLEQRERLRKKYASFIDLGLSKMTVSSMDERFLRKVAEIIEERLSDFEFDVGDLQDQMAMSRSQLFRKIKALTGESPVHLIRLMRLKVAAKSMEEGENSITDILMSVGFSNPSYFARCFKKKYGVTPREYQRAHVH